MKKIIILTRGVSDDEFDIWISDSEYEILRSISFEGRKKVILVKREYEDNSLIIVRTAWYKDENCINELKNLLFGSFNQKSIIFYHNLPIDSIKSLIADSNPILAQYSTTSQYRYRINLMSPDTDDFLLNKLMFAIKTENGNNDFVTAFNDIWNSGIANQMEIVLNSFLNISPIKNENIEELKNAGFNISHNEKKLKALSDPKLSIDDYQSIIQDVEKDLRDQIRKKYS